MLRGQADDKSAEHSWNLLAVLMSFEESTFFVEQQLVQLRSGFDLHTEVLYRLRHERIEVRCPGRIPTLKFGSVEFPSLPNGRVDDCLVALAKWRLLADACDGLCIANGERQATEPYSLR